MTEADKKQAEILREYVEKKPRPHICRHCEHAKRDSRRKLRCLELDSPKYMNVVTERDTCTKWEAEYIATKEKK